VSTMNAVLALTGMLQSNLIEPTIGLFTLMFS
jgi:hypothetical protein